LKSHSCHKVRIKCSFEEARVCQEETALIKNESVDFMQTQEACKKQPGEKEGFQEGYLGTFVLPNQKYHNLGGL
jgi:hypothetical protein